MLRFNPLDDFGRPLIAARNVYDEQLENKAWLDSGKTKGLPDLHNIIDMVGHRNEQIEKQFATGLHLHLHGSAPLESLTTSDDQS